MLLDKVIVVVGGTTGLGLSAAKACAAAGAKVVVVGRNEENCGAAVATIGDAACAVVGDATEPETSRRAIETAITTFAGFHGLYHVAGGSGRAVGDGPLDQISDNAWHATLQLNLTSMFNSNRAAVQQFLRQGSGGSILNMSSVLAKWPVPRYFATHAYATAKAAAIGLTTAAAAYYAERQIRFNALAPALNDTPMARRVIEDDEIRKYLTTKQPLDGGRIGQPADLDAAVVYFLSDESRFVTGQVLAVDGGWSVSEGQLPPASPE